MTVHRVAERLENSESLQDRPRLGRLQVIKRETVKKGFENDPIPKMTKFGQKSVSTVFRATKNGGEKSPRLRYPPCLERPKTGEERAQDFWRNLS